jgi:hypothetical protein
LIWVKGRRRDSLKLLSYMARRRLTKLFAALAVLAFLALAFGTACDLVPAAAAGSDDATACCASLEHGDALASPDLASPGTSGKALAGAPVIAYFFAGAVTLLGFPLFSTSAAQRPRSFYARSTRILR